MNENLICLPPTLWRCENENDPLDFPTPFIMDEQKHTTDNEGISEDGVLAIISKQPDCVSLPEWDIAKSTPYSVSISFMPRVST